MAFGGWEDWGWVQVWNNGSYAIDVLCSYCQDPVANKSRCSIRALRNRSVNSYYSYNWTPTYVGLRPLGSPVGGGHEATITAVVNGSKSQVWDPADIITEFTHDGNGNLGTVNVGQYKWDVTVGTNKVPRVGWTNFSRSFPKIDRSAGSGWVNTYSTNLQSVQIQYHSDVEASDVQYKLNNENWISVGGMGAGEKYFWINNLNPNTTYDVHVRHQRSYNGVWSTEYYTQASTPKPPAPTVDSISISNIGINSATFTMNNPKATSPGTVTRWQYCIDGTSWIDVSSNVFTLNDLNPNTSYEIQVSVMDSYGTWSARISTNFSTPKPNAPYLNNSSLTVSNVTPFTANFNWSGFFASEGASLSKYQYRINSGNWKDHNLVTNIGLTGLSEESHYKFEVRVVDNYGSVSGVLSVQFDTPSDQAKVRIKVSSSVKIGKVFINVGGQMKKVKKIYFNVGGQKKTMKNAG